MRSILIALIVMLGGSALAATPNPKLDQLLHAIDVVPASRVDLERQVPDAQAALIAAASDVTRNTYARQRAISFLSFYPDATTLAALDGLTRDGATAIRRAAVYSLGRTYGASSQKVADRIADIAERDVELEVRQHAVRALRWVDEPAAATRLQRLAERAELKTLAHDTLARRAKRLAR